MNLVHHNRRALVSALALASSAVVVPTLWAQARLEKSKISLAVEGKSSFHHLPLTIAEQRGFFGAEGLEVDISDLTGDSPAALSTASASFDVVSGAYEQTISLQSRGRQFQAFVLQGRAAQIAMGISPKALPAYQSVLDLKGKKIGVSALGSSSDMVASMILARAGLTPQDVSFIGVGTGGGAVNAFRAGHIDALSNVDPVMTMLEQKGEIRIIADTRTLKGSVDVFGGPVPAGCLYASAEFIQRNPNTVQALTYAIIRALKWLQTAGPGDIIKTVPPAYLMGDRALYLSAFNKVRGAISPDGLMADEGPRISVMALASFDSSIKLDKIDLSKTYTNAFARKAKARFQA
ncbi:MAG: ABC transporter substrate-binding protein [Rhodoferax sp.]|jgi:NitT/TauT family transport system substrate-binding protein|nr:ABC transporter substrate-binding protein [Rhodoferax sp.]